MGKLSDLPKDDVGNFSFSKLPEEGHAEDEDEDPEDTAKSLKAEDAAYFAEDASYLKELQKMKHRSDSTHDF